MVYLRYMVQMPLLGDQLHHQKNNMKVSGISGGVLKPEDKGGEEYDVSSLVAMATSDEQGFNVYGAISYRKV